MPELPDLEVIREYLHPRLAGAGVEEARVRRPLIVRNLLGGDPAAQLTGRRFLGARRRGKFLLLPFEDGATMAINPMLLGRLRLGPPLGRHRSRDALVLRLEGGQELRYHDAKDMGKIYLVSELAQVPTLSELGPEATDPELDLGAFLQRLRRHPGEIKGILTNQAFVAGIGNAYADEILWHARLYPFRRRPSLDAEELARLQESMRAVLFEAIRTLRERVGDAIDVEVRDFLAVHGKAGQPCPRCGTAISRVTRDRRDTDFCRQCQPGLMVAGPARKL
jgi:formamidopyrimidine-DNA glycosylase